MEPSRAHLGDINPVFAKDYPGDMVPWEKREARMHCSYCGSLHPNEAVALLKAGASISFADIKYGWPHKAYLDNPHAKFYTRHLVDATPEDKGFIEKALGLHIDFHPEEQTVSWRRYGSPAKEEP